MDDADPFAGSHKSVAAGELHENTNILKSAMHIFKANVGTGLFMLPTFYPDAGYILSPILFVMIGCVVLDCTHMLLNCKITINRRNVSSYSQLCRFVYGPAMQ
uniref:Proton-coupled amino acid transporter 4 n=1 Tax=Lygus hesperus TaxID=30085 RepID=A0A0A9XUP4_LYGHE